MKPAPMPDHLDSDLVAAYAERRLDIEERTRVEAHAAECAECRRVLTQVSVELAGLRRRRRLRLVVPAAAAATVAVLLLGVGRNRLPDPGEDSVRPAANAADESLSLPVHQPAPGSAVPRTALRFIWGADGRDALYDLTLADSSGLVVWSSRTADTVLALPDSIVMVPGARYYWWTDALRADGRIASTGSHEFVLER